jgi:hypothetical protein
LNKCQKLEGHPLFPTHMQRRNALLPRTGDGDFSLGGEDAAAVSGSVAEASLVKANSPPSPGDQLWPGLGDATRSSNMAGKAPC